MADTFNSNARRWTAVQSRDPLAATAFVYAVRTTQIFCRPTCPARLARRANVVFFDKTYEASAAGFRPCKRCKPTDEAPPSPRSNVINAVERAKVIIKDTRGATTWKRVCREVGVSPRYLHSAFRTVIGVTPGAYIRVSRGDTVQFETTQSTTDYNNSLPGMNVGDMDPTCPNSQASTYAGTISSLRSEAAADTFPWSWELIPWEEADAPLTLSNVLQTPNLSLHSVDSGQGTIDPFFLSFQNESEVFMTNGIRTWNGKQS